MKRILSLLLALALCLPLCACGKTEATKAAENAIASIGEVSLDSFDAITQAQIWDVVLDYAKKNDIGVIVISHEKALVDKICDRVVNLEEFKEEQKEVV